MLRDSNTEVGSVAQVTVAWATARVAQVTARSMERSGCCQALLASLTVAPQQLRTRIRSIKNPIFMR